MHSLAGEIVFVVAMLGGFSVMGGFVVVPFRRELPFVVLAAPLGGLLSMVLGIAAFYSFFDWSFEKSAVASGVLCAGTTLAALAVARPRIDWRAMGWALIAAAVTVPIITRTSNSTTLQLGSPGLLYCDATDAMGYAHAADWLTSHKVRSLPDATPEKPYAAWLTILWRVDPRFGSHFFLGLIASLRHVPAAFAFDSAATVAICAGVLGVAGAFSRTWRSLLVVICGLMLSYWYEYGQTGYLGKILGYPSTIMLFGLFSSLPALRSQVVVCVLAVVASATAMVHSAIATALVFSVTGVPFLVAEAALAARSVGLPKAIERIGPRFWAGVLVVGVALVTSGLLSRPMKASIYPDWRLGWSYILPRALDLEHQGIGIPNGTATDQPPLLMGHEEKLLSGMSVPVLHAVTAIALLVWVSGIALAMAIADPVAIGLLLGPAILLLVFRIENTRDGAFQLMGILYPLTVCGLGRIVDVAGVPERRRAGPKGLLRTALALVALSLGLRIPRYASSVHRYASARTLKLQRFSLARVNRLAETIGKEPVEVDVLSNTHSVFVVVELGRRGLNLRWTPQSWWTAFAYMKWPPREFAPPRLRLVLLDAAVPAGWRVALRSSPFKLLERTGSR